MTDFVLILIVLPLLLILATVALFKDIIELRGRRRGPRGFDVLMKDGKGQE